jgi:hypothetical protein
MTSPKKASKTEKTEKVLQDKVEKPKSKRGRKKKNPEEEDDLFQPKDPKVKDFLRYCNKANLNFDIKYQKLKIKTALLENQIYAFQKIKTQRFGDEADPNAESYGEFDSGILINLNPGFGKTLIGIAVLMDHIQRHKNTAGGMLVVCPRSVINDWIEQIAIHTTIPPQIVFIYESAQIVPDIDLSKPFILITR